MKIRHDNATEKTGIKTNLLLENLMEKQILSSWAKRTQRLTPQPVAALLLSKAVGRGLEHVHHSAKCGVSMLLRFACP